MIISVANSEKAQGKSSIAWLILGFLAKKGRRVIGIDSDVVNGPDDPVITDFHKIGNPNGFEVVGVTDANKSIFEDYDHVVIDGCFDMPGPVEKLIQKRSNLVFIPMQSTRGMTKGVDLARSLYKSAIRDDRQTLVCFVFNRLGVDVKDKFAGIISAYGQIDGVDFARVLDLGNRLEGISEITDAGTMPWVGARTERYIDIAEAAVMLHSVIEKIEKSIYRNHE